MKKNKMIIIIALTFILICSVGYAIFSENINISGTASAKGDFEFTATCQPGLSSEVPESLVKIVSDYNDVSGTEDYPSVESGYNNDTCSVSGKTVTFSADLKYPSAMRVFTIKITNTGSIPMSLDFYNINIDGIEYEEGIPHRSSPTTTDILAYYEKGNNLILSDNPTSKLLQGESSYFVAVSYWSGTDTNNDGKEKSYVMSGEIPFIQTVE